MNFRKWSKILTEEFYSKFIDDLWNGLSQLDFINNFNSFEVLDLELSAGIETKILNKLNKIPKHRIITKQSSLSIIKDGEWDKNYVRITSSIDCIVNIIYFS